MNQYGNEYEIEQWLPLRGRWLGHLGTGIKVGLVLLLLKLLPAMMPVTLGQGPKGPLGTARTQIGNFKTAIELYRIDHGGKPPTTQQGLGILLRQPYTSSDPHWNGPYLNDLIRVPRDPWRRAYVYSAPGPNGEPYLILSYGADGKPGGEGEAEDLTNVKR